MVKLGAELRTTHAYDLICDVINYCDSTFAMGSIRYLIKL